MSRFVIVCLLALPLLGCADSSRSTALRAWQSPDSSIEERTHPVLKLIPAGAPFHKVKSILGTNGSWFHSYGLRIDTSPTPLSSLPDYDFWCFHYAFPGGGVALYFDPPNSFGRRFVSAGRFWNITNLTTHSLE